RRTVRVLEGLHSRRRPGRALRGRERDAALPVPPVRVRRAYRRDARVRSGRARASAAPDRDRRRRLRGRTVGLPRADRPDVLEPRVILASIVTPKGSEADSIAGAWWLMFGLAAFVYVVVAGLIVYATVRGRRRGARTSRLHEDAFIWIGGVAAPVVILLVLAVVTVHTTEALRRPARDALGGDVAGEDWWWAVRYPGTDIVTANEVHLPVDRPVDLRLTSDNVIHSFWVPELAGKQDAIPGQPNHLRFTPEATGTFVGRC